MMMNKYRVHEVAKDFDKPSKSVIDLLGEYFEEPKKHMTALEEKELDVIFETFTQQNEVESFDAYFAMGKPAEAEQPARPAEKEAPAAKKRRSSRQSRARRRSRKRARSLKARSRARSRSRIQRRKRSRRARINNRSARRNLAPRVRRAR